MCKNRNAAVFKAVTKILDRGLPFETGDDDAGDLQPTTGKHVYETQYFRVIRRPKVGADFFAFAVSGIEANYHFSLITEHLQKAHLHIGVKSGKAACSVIVENKFAAKLQIELFTVLFDAFRDCGSLFFQVFVVVKSDLERHAAAY